MKRLVLLVCLAVGFSPLAIGQSSVVFDEGTALEITDGADLSADVVTVNGTLSGDGTINHAPLPVTLVSFTAQANPSGPGVMLEWVTATEVNNYGFTVQCREDSHQIFQDIPSSFVAGHGTTIEEHRYSYTHSTGVAGKHVYRLKQIDLDGTIHYPQVATLKPGQSAPAEEKPTEFVLSQNFPNPFNPSTTIRYGLPVKAHVTLVVYNALGQIVSRLVDEEQEAAYHEVRFDGTGLSSGFYFYKLEAGDFVSVRKILLVK